MTAAILVLTIAGWTAAGACYRLCTRGIARSEFHRLYSCCYAAAAFAFPVCLVGVLYWWWRLEMLWTPDELPEIESWMTRWTLLLVFSVFAGSFAIVQLRRGIPPARGDGGA